jgi:hypothetical protein
MFLMQTSALDFSPDLPNDIGVTDIRLTDTAVYEYVDWGYTGGYPVRNVDYGPVYVTLQNFGTDTLDQTEVRFEEFACPGICAGVLQYSWKLDNLALAPGESREFFLDDLSFACTHYDIHTLCLYTMNPNREPDAVVANDRFCIQVDVLADVSDQVTSGGVNIYPNPASDRVFISLPGDMHEGVSREVTILDTNGRRVLFKQMHQGVNEIELDGLSQGIYIVCIATVDQMIVCSRIIVI